MWESKLALASARGRIAIGVFAVAAPAPATRMFLGRSQASGAEPQLTRMVGIRDLALGLGTAIAIDKGTPVRGWLEAAAVADAGDLVAALLGRKQMSQQAFIGTLALTSGAVVVGLVLARRVEKGDDRI
jgi:hypothetical protein